MGLVSHVYILRCADFSLYIGITDDLRRRLARHQDGRGCESTRSRLPVALVWSEFHAILESVIKRER